MERVAWPDGDMPDSFKFNAVHPNGVFAFQFRWFNGRWNCWCTLPSGGGRPAGVEPGVASWTGFTDYGLLFITNLQVIDRPSLALAKLFILEWE